MNVSLFTHSKFLLNQVATLSNQLKISHTMRKLTILVGAIMSLSFSYGQKISEKQVPALVKSALVKKYPDAKSIKWEKESTNYESGFDVNQTEYSLLIDASGVILETEIEIKISELPAKAKDYISKNFPGAKIKEAAKIIDNKGMITYEAELKGKDFIFDGEGNFIKY